METMNKITEGVKENSQKLVQMRFFKETIDKVEELKDIRKARNKTQVVAEAISVFYIICKAIEKQGSVILTYPNGVKENIILP